MKKLIFFTIVLALFFSLPAYATEVHDEVLKSLADEINDFKSSIPTEIIDFLPDSVWDGDFDQILNSQFNESTIIESIVNYIFSGLNAASKSFVSILVIIIISSLFHTLSSSFSSNSVKSAVSLVTSLCMSITIFNLCNSIGNSASKYISSLCNVMEAFSPLMASLYIMTGNLSSGGIANASLVLFISIIERFLIVFMLPIVNICLCFSMIKALGGYYDFSGISKILKNSFISITVFVMSIFMFILSCKNVLTQASDSLSIKTAKFAISSFVPFIGGTVNEALRTVSASLSAIKNSCGIIAIIIIALIMLPIIINLLISRLMFNLSASISKALNCNNEGFILEEAGSICGFFLVLVICTCILFIFALTILIKTTVIL